MSLFVTFLNPKIGSKLVNFWTKFGCLFLRVWEVFGCVLGILLGFLSLSCEASAFKNLKNLRFFKVFENAGFWISEVSGGLLGLTLAPLGPK